MNRHSLVAGRSIRWAALVAVLLFALVLVQVGLAQSDAPAAVANGTLTVGKTTTPAGGQDFWVTAASFQKSWGGGGKSNGKYRQPRDVAVDAAGNFYISDHRNSRVTKLDADGDFLTQIGARGKGNGKLLRPNAIAVAGSKLYVTDTDNHRVAIFNTNGSFDQNWGSLGSGNGQFNFPQGIAVDGSGNVYVADTFNHRIQVFNAAGVYQRQWGTLGSGPGQLRYPTHIDFDASGNLYVADSNNNRIQVFTDQGTFVRQFGVSGSGPGQFRLPVGLDVGEDGFVYVSDTYNNRVQKLTATGSYVGAWSQAQGGKNISRPNGLLAVGNWVYASDIDAHRIQIFSQASFLLDHGQQESTSLPAGLYWITEAPKSGWTLGSATCNAGSPAPITGGVSVTLADGASLTCSFANQQ
jgi:hypothetical protein